MATAGKEKVGVDGRTVVRENAIVGKRGACDGQVRAVVDVQGVTGVDSQSSDRCTNVERDYRVGQVPIVDQHVEAGPVGNNRWAPITCVVPVTSPAIPICSLSTKGSAKEYQAGHPGDRCEKKLLVRIRKCHVHYPITVKFISVVVSSLGQQKCRVRHLRNNWQCRQLLISVSGVLDPSSKFSRGPEISAIPDRSQKWIDTQFNVFLKTNGIICSALDSIVEKCR